MSQNGIFFNLFGPWLVRPFLRLLNWLGVGRPMLTCDTTDIFKVFVKISGGNFEQATIPLALHKGWSVKDVKHHLGSKLQKSSDSFKIILAGRELNDSILVGDCDLGPQTIIHAISVILVEQQTSTDLISNTTNASEAPLNASLLDLQLTEEEKVIENSKDDTVKRRAHFYVYCDSPTCRANVPQPGKLRVRCSLCREGAVMVLNDPCSWDDVLLPSRIEGVCHNTSCLEFRKLVYVQFYFKCRGENHQLESDDPQESETPPLNLIRPNIRQIPCLSCGDSEQEDGCVIVFECPEKHVICIDCFKLYISARLNERQFILDETLGYTLGCAAGCENALISQLKHFKLFTPYDYERYQRFATEELVLQSGGVLCPQPNCGMGMITEDKRVVCTSCQFVFCRTCLQGYHIGECEETQEKDGDLSLSGVSFVADPTHLPLARWNENQDPRSLVAIRLMTKPCPKCRTATERDGGCMHMSCTKAGCGFQWCWVCQTEWTRDCMASHWFG